MLTSRGPGSVLNAPHALSHSLLGSYQRCHHPSTAKLTQQKKQICIIWKNEESFPESYSICKIIWYDIIWCVLYDMYSATQLPEGCIGVKFFQHEEDTNWVIQREVMWWQLQSVTDENRADSCRKSREEVVAMPTITRTNLSWKQLLCKNAGLKTDSIKYLSTCHHNSFQSTDDTCWCCCWGR